MNYKRSTLFQQVSKRHGDTYKCKKCGKSFDNMLTLKSHQRTHNSVAEPGGDTVECNQCGVRMKKMSYKNHLLLHSDEKPFPCNFCDRRFRRKDHLKIHSRTHENASKFT